MSSHVHPQMPPQFQPQSQNMGQAYQGQQPGPNHPQPKGNQASQYPQGQYANYDPQLALWIMKKGKHLHWQDVKPQQQQLSLPSLQDELDHARRSEISVKRTLNQIPSDSAREIVNGIVPEQNRILWQWNPNIQWTIAGLDLQWKSLNRHKQQLISIDILLKTESRSYSYDRPPNGRMNAGIPGYPHGLDLAHSTHTQAPKQKNKHNQGPEQEHHFDQPQGRGNSHNQGPNHGFPDPPPPPPPPPPPNVGQQPGPPPPPPNVGQQSGLPPPPPPPNVGQQPGLPPPPPNVGQHSSLPPPPPPPNVSQHAIPIPPPPPPPASDFPKQKPQQQQQQAQHRNQQNQNQQNQNQQHQHPQNQQHQHPQNQQHQHQQNQLQLQQLQQLQQLHQQRLQQQQQQQQQELHNIQNQLKSMPGAFPEPGPHPSMRREPLHFPPVETTGSRMLKKKQSQPKSLRREYVANHVADSSSSGEESEISDSIYTCTSSEDYGYSMVGGRSRNPSRKSSVRAHSKARSPSRGRGTKEHSYHNDRATSRMRNKSDFVPPPMGKHSGTSTKNNSPRSSTGGIPSHIHIHMNPPPSARDNDRHIDIDRRRESDSDKDQAHHRKNSAQPSFELSPRSSTFKKPVYSHHMSPTSSGHGSDTNSVKDGSSSVYSMDGNESIFSEPTQNVRNPRHNNYPQSEIVTQLPHRSRSQRPRGDLHHQNLDPFHKDFNSHPKAHYPAEEYSHHLLHRMRQNSYHPEIHHIEEPHYNDRDVSLPWGGSRPQPTRRNSVQVPFPISQEPVRYQPQRTLSYSTVPEPRYITETAQNPPGVVNVEDVVEATLEALQQKKADAQEHIQWSQSMQRMPLRRNTMNNRVPPGYVEQWDNSHMPIYGGIGGQQGQRPMGTWRD